ncbi:MAG: type II toxin-antitoxin system VapC family toxin [Akkermansiaceae bacterium]
MILVDTTFLIDLQRSSRNPRHQAAEQWLVKHAEAELVLPVIVLGEFAEGFTDPAHPVLEHYRTAHRVIAVDERVALKYGNLSRNLRQQGNSIGGNDTWIAATALAHGLPLLTRNANHYKRVQGIQLEEYGI